MRFTKKKTIIGILAAVVVLVVAAWLATPLSKRNIRVANSLPPSRGDSLSDDMEIAPMSAPALSEGISQRDMIPPREQDGDADFEDVTREDRLVIKSARMSVVSKDVPAAVQGLKEYAQTVGGFIVGVDLKGMENAPSATVT